jgi:hypothetical protein
MPDEFKQAKRQRVKSHGTRGRKRWIQRAKNGSDFNQSGLLRRAEMGTIRTKNGVKKVGIFIPTPL